jgi:hypothetical protein
MLSLEWRERPDSREVEARLSELCADPQLPKFAAALDAKSDSPHSSSSRLVTTMVALDVGRGAERDERIALMREVGAEATGAGRASRAEAGIAVGGGGKGNRRWP